MISTFKKLLGVVVITAVGIPGANAALGTYPALESTAVGQSSNSSTFGGTKIYLAGLVGGNLLDDSRGVRVSYGARAGILFNSKLSLGGYFNRLPVASNSLGTVNMNTFAGEALYSLYGQNQGIFLGARVGTTFTIINSDGVSTTHTGLALMPVLGFEDVIDQNLMWGVETSYLVSTNDISPTGFNLLGSLKLVLF